MPKKDLEKVASVKRVAVKICKRNAEILLRVLLFWIRPWVARRSPVIGITGTNGKTTTTHLVEAMYEAGVLHSWGYYIHGDNKSKALNTMPDEVTMQKLMAKMVHNGIEVVVMEASSHGLLLGRCNEIDFDIVVCISLTRYNLDFHGTEEEYMKSKGKLFTRMVDHERHRKVVNIDDPNSPYFIGQGNPDVPLVTSVMEKEC